MAVHTLADAFAAVAHVGPIAREHAQKAEAGRGLSVEVIDAFETTGLWRTFVPADLDGGNLMGLTEQFDLVRAMAYEDSSAGWALFIGGVGVALFAAKLPPAGREEIFGGGVTPIAGVFNPGGQAQSTDGGVRVSGRWPFASGVGYSQWVMGNTILLDESGAPRPGVGGVPEIRSVIVPASDVTIVDDWHVAGMRGTGSMSFMMDDVFVPEHRTFPFFGPVSRTEAKLKLPLMTLLSPGFIGMAVGLADRALDEICAVLPTRVGPPTFQPASEDPVIQSKLGHAMATIRAARESTRAVFGPLDARIAQGEDLTDLAIGDRAAIHQHASWTATTCRGAVNELFDLGGANSIYEPGVLQRTWRDINVLTHHLYLRTSNLEHAAKLAVGIEVDSPFI